MKRKAETQGRAKKPLKKKTKIELTEDEAKQRFRKGLFEKSVRDKYASQYRTSTPYKHSVIHELVDDKLLRSVRAEIRDNVSFTPKETDIYKIHQSGDLANLDGLDDSALAKLPSLLALRDAIYSDTFRAYVSHVTGCGALSGRKTDMAINVYTPGCYLLCHDDVIGSRRVSYILYLTDPDMPWKPEWGGALRLFPVTERKGEGGAVAKTVEPDVVKVIPPAWNQLSFFAVQPGESFHDVEEVYRPDTKEELASQGGRVRMAISGWFHIPQVGEEGYVKGAEEAQVKNSGLMQLQGDPDQHDLPRDEPVPVGEGDSQDLLEFDEADLEFLLKYLAPTYLTPDTLEQVSEHFEENSFVTLTDLLHPKFAARLREYVTKQEAAAKAGLLPSGAADIEAKTAWKVARPPHKHRFLYMQSGVAKRGEEESPLRELLDTLLPSRQFRAWLQMATGCNIKSHAALARRFRRGEDYTLAMGHEGDARLELNLGLTPTSGWGDDEDEEDDEEEEAEEEAASSSKTSKANGKSPKDKGKGKEKARSKATEKAKAKEREKKKEEPKEEEEEEDVGGHEVYMAGEDDNDEDAAVYKSGTPDEDNILFFQAAAWNKMTIVLRDSGTLRFVKYVSRSAKGDRWDISANFDIEEQDDGDDDGDEEGEGERAAVGVVDDSSEEEFKGFSPSEDSDSD
ncbi:PKHD-type hydroxylase TPA1 [Gaeumannomyces tritici R3-111a-1]|uniref:uS12 prolyl 3,4-dihydroxylase n=1 Tax=Gaeumannomyces tritici (strain R3-111a-1) TaxID=644352 RepID=J3NL33_GAET3|nr:PKHD-type hydroxylase TPA1 [Gaeumannomyces tritici R3-111a-1]EJT82000.1 PKHD-type hydroxylase TPA1 [Gaeumannomyces tritici R3-111a-1]